MNRRYLIQYLCLRQDLIVLTTGSSVTVKQGPSSMLIMIKILYLKSPQIYWNFNTILKFPMKFTWKRLKFERENTALMSMDHLIHFVYAITKVIFSPTFHHQINTDLFKQISSKITFYILIHFVINCKYYSMIPMTETNQYLKSELTNWHSLLITTAYKFINLKKL